MPQTFAGYTETSVNAFEFNPKNQEVIDRKQEILRSIAQHHGSNPTSVLFYGFSPMILSGIYKTNFSLTNFSTNKKIPRQSRC